MSCIKITDQNNNVSGYICISPKKKKACEQCNEWDELDNCCYDIDCRWKYNNKDIGKESVLCQWCKRGTKKDRIITIKRISDITNSEYEINLCPKCKDKWDKELEESGQ